MGFQCHLNVGINYNYENLRKNIKRFTELDVEVYITELDVGLNLWGQGGNHKKVSDVIKTQSDWDNFFEEQNNWGFRDDIPFGGWRIVQKGWMVNKVYSRKGAYYAVLKGLYDADQNKK